MTRTTGDPFSDLSTRSGRVWLLPLYLLDLAPGRGPGRPLRRLFVLSGTFSGLALYVADEFPSYQPKVPFLTSLQELGAHDE